jgi:hypothetical protein
MAPHKRCGGKKNVRHSDSEASQAFFLIEEVRHSGPEPVEGEEPLYLSWLLLVFSANTESNPL